MTPSFALAALFALAAQAPATDPPPAAEPPKDEAPAAPPEATPPAEAPKDASPPPEAVKPVEPPKVEEPKKAEKPKDEKLALVLGDLSVTPRAQLRVRGESIGNKTLQPDLAPATIFTHRARLGLGAEWKDVGRFVVDMQDVRGWGAEVTAAPPAPQDVTLFGKVANSVDMHQAFAGVFIGPTELRVGRQEIAFANERVLGAVDWVQQARAFDAISIANKAPGDFGYLAFCSIVRDLDHTPTATAPGLALCGVGVEHKIMPAFRYAPLVMVEATDNETLLSRATFGARFDGAVAGFSYDVDAFGQTSWVGTDVKLAYLAGVRAAYEVDTMLKPKAGITFDYVSGGDPATADVVTFNTTYGTNHKFYGFQDLFLNLPVDTANRGLLDAALNLAVKEGPFSAQLAVHVFGPTAGDGGGALYGIEPDLVGKYDLTKQVSLQVGGSLFVPVGEALGRGDQTTPWAFAMLDVKL
ncbi:MAG: alginate export family protein [Deltaproteobacteria bacterium]|nr:alginate export family protein [Deltaproteobacteria bacterium]